MSEKHYEQEEAFHQGENRAFRQEKKRKTQKDRSKYKKSNWDQRTEPKAPEEEGLCQGRVLRIEGGHMFVDAQDKIYQCTLKGSLKKEQLQKKNLVAVGDFVLFKPLDGDEGVVVFVKERFSTLSRTGQLHKHKEQIIAVNIDQVLITASILEPILKPNLIDRYLIATYRGDMEPVILINKIDLLGTDSEEDALVEKTLETYQNLGIIILLISTKTGEGMDKLKEVMKDKASVFSGQSGAGKTSLINTVTGLKRKTRATSARTKKGTHTTTHALLLPLEEGGFCIDTPGIRSFGMWNLEKQAIRDYFFEIKELGQKCRYPNCAHLKEPDCAVQEGVKTGEISPLRFESYCALMTNDQEKKR